MVPLAKNDIRWYKRSKTDRNHPLREGPLDFFRGTLD
jgi:hypothetical protein